VVESYIKHGVVIPNSTFITMHPLEAYYPNQTGRGLPSAPGIGSIYSATLYIQRGHGVGNFLGTLFHFVRPFLWTVGRTGGKIITDIAKNKSPDVSSDDIISKYVGEAVTESTRHLIGKLRGRGLKRARRLRRRRREVKCLKRPLLKVPG